MSPRLTKLFKMDGKGIVDISRPKRKSEAIIPE